MMNYGVFIIECRMDAVVFMAALVRYLYVLADRYPDISNTRPGIYAGGSMSMVRHGLMHSVNDVDIAFRDRELANALRNMYGKDYFKNYKFAGVDIDFGPAAAVLEDKFNSRLALLRTI